jgi:phytanoyl-CoA hydroxylase
MTKQPGFSSATLWHQDNRYWSFDQENLVSVWLALTDEDEQNGCLCVIPGSHRMTISPECFDSALFLRTDAPVNRHMIAASVAVPLRAGDVLFFHSRLFHAAGRNETDETKLSLVYTYHAESNRPVAGTRSARFPSIAL